MSYNQLHQQAYCLCLKHNREDALTDLHYLSYGELEGLVMHLLRLNN